MVRSLAGPNPPAELGLGYSGTPPVLGDLGRRGVGQPGQHVGQAPVDLGCLSGYELLADDGRDQGVAQPDVGAGVPSQEPVTA